jgi:hypothetical protein
MNLINILLILIILLKYNQCNEIEIIKKEINNFKELVKYLGQSMHTKITEFKEETNQGIY